MTFAGDDRGMRGSGFSLIRSGWSGLRGCGAAAVPPLRCSLPPLTYRVAPRRGGEGGRCCGRCSLYCRDPSSGLPPLCSEFRRASTAKCFGPGDMAGYLKVLSSLSRSAAAFSRSPAVLAPAANCQPQRNCEWRDNRCHPQHLVVLAVNCCST